MTNVLITGGSRGIGYELVKQFAAQSDNHIVVLSRNFDKLEQLKEECIQLYKNVIHIYKVDFNSPSFVDEAQNILAKEDKHFHILVNNAGILINKPFKDIMLEDWTHSFNVNLFAPVIIIKEVLGHNHNKNEKLHVVNISSMGGFQGSSKFPGLTSYGSSKAALANLTEVLAEEYKDSNVVFNCLALGAVQTEMLKEAFPTYNSPMSAKKMAEFIIEFSIHGSQYFNGKIIPVSLSTP